MDGQRTKKKKHGKRTNAEISETQRTQRREKPRNLGRGNNPARVDGEISAAGHRRFYRGSLGRSRRLRKEDSRGAGEKFRRRAGQRQTLPWHLRECRDG